MTDSQNPFDREEGEDSLRDVFDSLCEHWEYFHLDKASDYGEKVINVVTSLENGSNQYLTLGNTSLQVLNSLYETYDGAYRRRSSDRSQAWNKFNSISDKGAFVTPDYTTDLFVPYIRDAMVIKKMTSGDDDEDNSRSEDNLYKCFTPSDHSIYWVNSGYNQYSGIVCEDPDDVDEIRKEIAQSVWDKYDGHIEMFLDEKRQDFLFKTKEGLPWEYKGVQGRKLLNRWKQFKEKGMRRSIILHGKPGTGKSTLARQATQELEGDVVFVPVETLIDCRSIEYFSQVLEILEPDILIIDDLDRLHHSDLESLLSFFEETENPVPFILATTNHLDNLPDAIKRPGRFDEIWEIEPPSDEVREKVISYLAELEDFDLSEETTEKIAKIAKENDLPGSHIREIIRRVKVVGEEDGLEFSDNDMTFDEEWNLDPEEVPPNGTDQSSSGGFTLEDF